MLPVLFGGTCDWKWKEGPTMTAKRRKRGGRERSLLSSQLFTFYFHFFWIMGRIYLQRSHCRRQVGCPGSHSHGYCVAQAEGAGVGVRGGKWDDRAGVKDVGGKRSWFGVRADFHFSPLSLC